MLASTKWKNYGGGLDEIDIMSLRPILMKLRWLNFQKSMRHEGSNERASDNVRRVDVLFV